MGKKSKRQKEKGPGDHKPPSPKPMTLEERREYFKRLRLGLEPEPDESHPFQALRHQARSPKP